MELTAPAALVVEWLNAQPDVTALVADRIATIYRPEDGGPAVLVGEPFGGPNASQGVDVIETWRVALYVMDDDPTADVADLGRAWDVVAAVVAGARATSKRRVPWRSGTGARIRRVEVASATRVRDGASGIARAVVTLTFTVWA